MLRCGAALRRRRCGRPRGCSVLRESWRCEVTHAEFLKALAAVKAAIAPWEVKRLKKLKKKR